MQGKKILIAISGSIAAYKIPSLIRLCIQAGAEVKVVMTPAAAQFVSPLVISTLTKHPVEIEMATSHTWANHVALGRWADILLVAPASCNTLAKMAHGICDNLLLSVYFSATCPVHIAPAMDEDMWAHPTVKKNIQHLQEHGCFVMDTDHGELASGLIGYGRMKSVEFIFQHLQVFFQQSSYLQGKKALITAGPTYENIDPVRYIGNYSTGKMGIAIALQMAEKGCAVELILGPTSHTVQHPNIHVYRVRSASQMFDRCAQIFPEVDIAVMSAAVADFTPMQVANHKIKKGQDSELTLTLTKTKDILQHLGATKTNQQLVVGFALETTDAHTYALKKLQDKNADLIVMNSLADAGAGFAVDTNKVTFFEKSGEITELPLLSKTATAQVLVDKIISLCKK